MAGRVSEASVRLDTLLKWIPILAVPSFGCASPSENILTSLELRVTDLEEQVDNYHETEQHLLETKARLDYVQRLLDDSRGAPR